MKELTVIGLGGIIIAKTLVDIEGNDFSISFPIPLFLPLVGIHLVELSEDRKKEVNHAGTRSA